MTQVQTRAWISKTRPQPRRGSGESGDEEYGVSYNWSLFHAMFALSTLYMMMTLTNWYSPGKDVSIESISANMSAVWVKGRMNDSSVKFLEHWVSIQ